MQTPHHDSIDPQLLKAFQLGMRQHIGVQQAITAADILAGLKKSGYKRANPVQIRKIVHYLRAERIMLICGDTNGYYLAANPEEATRQINSMRSRIREIGEACDGIQEMASMQFQQ